MGLLRLSLKPTQHFYMVLTMATPTIWDTDTVPTMVFTMDFMPVLPMAMDFLDTATLMLTVFTNVRLRLILKSLPMALCLMSMTTLLSHMPLPLQPLLASTLLFTTQVIIPIPITNPISLKFQFLLPLMHQLHPWSLPTLSLLPPLV